MADRNGVQQNLAAGKNHQPMLFFSAEYITVAYDALHQWIDVDWKGYQTESSVKEGCEQILKALQAFACQKVLNDNTHVVGIWTPASVWVGSNWFPRMQAAGLRYFAWVYSPSAFSQISTDEALKYTPIKDVVKTFYDIHTAKEWLCAANKP